MKVWPRNATRSTLGGVGGFLGVCLVVCVCVFFIDVLSPQKALWGDFLCQEDWNRFGAPEHVFLKPSCSKAQRAHTTHLVTPEGSVDKGHFLLRVLAGLAPSCTFCISFTSHYQSIRLVQQRLLRIALILIGIKGEDALGRVKDFNSQDCHTAVSATTSTP